MSLPFCNQADLLTNGPRLCRENRHWDDEGHERTERRTGAVQCPRCGLWWPSIEQPDTWEVNDETGKWDAIGWWGGVACEECGLLMVEMPDGSTECYGFGR